MYSDQVMEHFSNPRNVGVIDDADGIGKVGNPMCGDVMEMFIKVKDNHVDDVKFRTFGCGAAIATSSIATQPRIRKAVRSMRSFGIIAPPEMMWALRLPD